MHPKTGEEGRSCTWHILAFKTVILFFTSPQPSTHTIPCEQPAELLLSVVLASTLVKEEHVFTFSLH